MNRARIEYLFMHKQEPEMRRKNNNNAENGKMWGSMIVKRTF